MKKTLIATLLLLVLLTLAGGCSTTQEAVTPIVTPTYAPVVNSAPETAASPSVQPAAGHPSDVEGTTATSAQPEAEQTTKEQKPANSPAPLEQTTPQPSAETTLTCTLRIRCDTILDNMEILEKEKADLVPADGVLLQMEEIPFEEGESVFDLLLRVTRDEKIHLEFVDTPLLGSAYIEGIGNLYEFDCGELSGWSYKVNGVFPGYGCSQYTLVNGDTVEWLYTCDLGNDIGGGNKVEGGT